MEGLVLADLGVVHDVDAVVALRLSVHAGQRHSAAQLRIRGGQQGQQGYLERAQQPAEHRLPADIGQLTRQDA